MDPKNIPLQNLRQFFGQKNPTAILMRKIRKMISMVFFIPVLIRLIPESQGANYAKGLSKLAAEIQEKTQDCPDSP
jgi:hypothetical protein